MFNFPNVLQSCCWCRWFYSKCLMDVVCPICGGQAALKSRELCGWIMMLIQPLWSAYRRGLRSPTLVSICGEIKSRPHAFVHKHPVAIPALESSYQAGIFISRAFPLECINSSRHYMSFKGDVHRKRWKRAPCEMGTFCQYKKIHQCLLIPTQIGEAFQVFSF